MKIECVIVGDLQCNCYILERDGEVLIVDPGDEVEKILEVLGNREVKGILVTHSHFDHVGCLDSLKDKYSCPVYRFDTVKEEEVEVGKFKFFVIHTLGHSKDSISFYFRDDHIMFTGDFLFYDTVGRCDLDGGDYREMLSSIDKIKKYSDDIIIYPGHGKSSILGREKKYNIYFGDDNERYFY